MGYWHLAAARLFPDRGDVTIHPVPRVATVAARSDRNPMSPDKIGIGLAPITKWVSPGTRDAAAAAQAASYARAVLRGEQTLAEAFSEMDTWVATYPENVAGAPQDPEKARQLVLTFVRYLVVDRNKVLPQDWASGLTEPERAEHCKYLGVDGQEWTRTRALDHLAQAFVDLPPTAIVERMEIIEEVLLGMARSRMDQFEIEKVLSFVQTAGRTKTPIRALRKRLQDLQSGGLKGENHTDIALALIKELEQHGEVRFSNDTFYRWTGCHWKALRRSEVLKVVAQEFGNLPLAKRYWDHLGIADAASHLLAGRLADQDEPGINFANGYLTVDLELKAHDPSFGATYVLPYRYVPDAPLPTRFMSVLDRSWSGDADFADKVQALREAMAVTMFGLATRFTRAICLYGIPFSGKTVIMDVMRGMVPEDSCSNVSPHDWGDRFLPTQMVDRLINICGEISETKMIKGHQFKMIVEGAERNGQYKGGQIFRFKPNCAQWFSSNHLPRTLDTSSGFTRRWLFLTFNRAVPEGTHTNRFQDVILAEERETIAAWALPAIADVLRRGGYTIPASHLEQLDEIANLNNSVRHFLKSSRVVYAPDACTREGALFTAYVRFAKSANHRKPMSRLRFRTELRMLQRELGFQLKLDGESDLDPPIIGIAPRQGSALP